MNGKVPQHTAFQFLLASSKDLRFHRIILKCDNEPSTKTLQDAVIQACGRVEEIPQGPPEGDLMANGRVEMAVREVKRQCRTLRITAEQNTGMCIADDSSVIQWASSFCIASHEQNESRQRWNNE